MMGDIYSVDGKALGKTRAAAAARTALPEIAARPAKPASHRRGEAASDGTVRAREKRHWTLVYEDLRLFFWGGRGIIYSVRLFGRESKFKTA